MQERMRVPGLEAVVNAALSLGSDGRGKNSSGTGAWFVRWPGAGMWLRDGFIDGVFRLIGCSGAARWYHQALQPRLHRSSGDKT